MKIKKLQFVSTGFYVGEQGKADSTTHEIDFAPNGYGYLLRHKRSGQVHFVPFALAAAQLEEEDEPAKRGGRQAAGGTRPPKVTPPIPA